MARKRRNNPSQSTREFDPARWAYVVFALGAFLGAWVFSNAIEDLWGVAWSIWPQYVSRANPATASIVGILVALGGAILATMRQKWFRFVTEVVVEVSQVVWPSRAEVRAATSVVIVITLISSGILATMDSTWSAITDWLYGV